LTQSIYLYVYIVVLVMCKNGQTNFVAICIASAHNIVQHIIK